jgi:sugar-specific transcriptional regulator TrmB
MIITLKKILKLRLNQFIRNDNLGEMHHPYAVTMQNNEAIEKLRQLGLTEYEAQAYLALAQGNQMSAEEVAKGADIPIPRVYGVLESLKTLGLIVILKGRPKKFEILSPDEGFKHLLAQRKRMADESLRQLEKTCQEVKEVLSPIFWRERLRIRPEDLLEALDNLALSETRTKKIIAKARKSVDIFTDIFSWFDDVESTLAEVVKRGVKVRVLLNMEHQSTKNVIKKLKGYKIAVRQPPDLRFPVRGTLVDASKVIFLIWASPEGGEKSPKYVYRPSYSANEGIVAIFQHSFEYRWQQAKSLKST